MPIRAPLSLMILLATLIAASASAAPRPAPLPGPTLNVTVFYEGRALVKLLDIRSDQVIQPNGYRLGARLQTAGAIGALKRATVLAQAEGPLVAGSPTPGEFITDDGKRHRVVRYHNVGPRSPADPLTQLLRAGFAPGAASPCIGSLRVEDGRQTYDLILSSAGGGDLSGSQKALGLSRPVRCRVGFHPVSGFKPGASLRNPMMNGEVSVTFARPANADLWIASDIAVGLALGEGHISLTGLKIAGARPAPQSAPVPTSNRPVHPPSRKDHSR